MSEANVEIIRKAFAVWEESHDLERFTEAWADDVEFQIASQMGRDSADFRTAHGIEASRALARDFLSAFESWRWRVDDVIDAGGDRVVALVEGFGRIPGSETEVASNPLAYVFTFRNAEIVRVQDFPDRAEALEAVGLPPGD